MVLKRTLALLAAAPAFLSLGATSALAGATTPIAAIDVTSSGLYDVTSFCSLVAGYTTDTRFVTYVIRASATAKGPSAAIATGVSCTAYSGGIPRGGASGGLPGPHAEAVGQAIVPVGEVPALCVSGGATYLDGKTVAENPCP